MTSKSKLVPRQLLVPFILVTTLFFAWGFANDITNPMVKAFSKIFRMSVTDGALVQLAFYGGYFAMAFPAALFIRKYSYKTGILLGLGLYSVGALLFIPASMTGLYYPFLIAYFILTCGLSFLETSSNPYILTMGDESTATRRLNLAQAFNPIGSLLGMFTAMAFIQAKLSPLSTAERAQLSPEEFEVVKAADLQVLIAPYVAVGLIVLLLFLIIRFTKMPKNADQDHSLHLGRALKRIFSIPRYREGVIAQFFYVGVQIMCWPFLLKYFSPGKLLMTLAIGGAILTAGVIGFQDIWGMYCLVGVSACMSLMFPTIYGIALQGLGDDAKFGAAGLIMAILGGSIMPPLQAAIIDCQTLWGIPAVNASFILPLICFLVIIFYGYRSYSVHQKTMNK